MKLIEVSKININKKSKDGIDIKKIQVIQKNIEIFEELDKIEKNDKKANVKLCMVSGRDIYVQEGINYIMNNMLKQG